MSIELDHLIVPCRDRRKSAKLLAELFGVSWGPASVGPFHAVYVSDGLTLDFDETPEPFPLQHYCFRVDAERFEAILARIKAAGISHRSLPQGPADLQVNTAHGGKIVYWDQPDGHVWEILTLSYARQSKRDFGEFAA
jgi:catechol 2,3-dioxygenase-like lactoylglutathione lyase family enzyme